MASHGKTRQRKAWQRIEDETLLRIVRESQPVFDWKEIAHALPGRTARQCRRHWNFVIDPSIKKEPWSAEEERQLTHLRDRLGYSWAEVSKRMEGRTQMQCRNQWTARLNASFTAQGTSAPSEHHAKSERRRLSSPGNVRATAKWTEVKDEQLLSVPGYSDSNGRGSQPIAVAGNEPWTAAEDMILRDVCSVLGTDWETIAGSIPGRTRAHCKQRASVLLRFDTLKRAGLWENAPPSLPVRKRARVAGNAKPSDKGSGAGASTSPTASENGSSAADTDREEDVDTSLVSTDERQRVRPGKNSLSISEEDHRPPPVGIPGLSPKKSVADGPV